MVKTINKIKRKTARIIVKKRIKYRNRLTLAQDKKRRKRITNILMLLAVLLILLPGYLGIRHKLSTHQITDETITLNQELYTLANLVYRHKTGYANYCRKQGQSLKSYPNAFVETYKSELIIFNQKAKEIGLPADKIIAKIQKEFAVVSEKSIHKEFKKLLTKRIQNTDGTVIQTEKDLCLYIDTNPQDWIQRHKSSLDQIKKSVKHIQEIK